MVLFGGLGEGMIDATGQPKKFKEAMESNKEAYADFEAGSLFFQEGRLLFEFEHRGEAVTSLFPGLYRRRHLPEIFDYYEELVK